MAKSPLNPHRFFDSDPTIRKIAIDLYHEVKDLPIVSPHGHVEPKLLADNSPFPDPTELILIPDHYVFRMLYSQGVSMESVGIPTIDGTSVESDHRKIWQIFADHYYLFDATPTGAWLGHVFGEVFGIQGKLNENTHFRRIPHILRGRHLRKPQNLGKRYVQTSSLKHHYMKI